MARTSPHRARGQQTRSRTTTDDAVDQQLAPSAAGSKDARSSQLAKEAKNLRAVLKVHLQHASEKASSHGSLPSLTSPNSDLEFARKNLRNTYLNLLFSCTFTRAAHGVDSGLWIETTHPLVQIYRKHLHLLEKTIASLNGAGAGSKRGASNRTQGGAGASGNGNAGTSSSTRKAKLSELNRVATEYRKFLLSEEVFWQELAARVVHTFQLHEAKPMFEALGVVYDPDSSTITSSSSHPPSSGGGPDFSRVTGRAGAQASTTLDPDDVPRNAAVPGSSAGMNRIQGAGTTSITSSGASAAEAAAQVKAATIPSNRDRLIEIVHKAFICCGDLARYRVQVSEREGTATVSASATDGFSSNKGPAKSKAVADFSRPAAFYTQARLLLPDNGNPSNQLAVIATMLADPLNAVHHYYRALCCRVPFETARQNLDQSLGRGVETWARGLESAALAELQAQAHTSGRASGPGSSAMPNSVRLERGWRPRRLRQMVTGLEAEYASSDPHAFVELWKREFVALHGLFHRKVYFTSLEALNQVVVARFAILVRNRALTPDVISKVIISGLSASWTTRLWRNTSSGNGASSRTNSEARRSSSGKQNSVSAAAADKKGKGTDSRQPAAAEDEEDLANADDDEDDEFFPPSFNSEKRQAMHVSIENQLVAHVLEVIRVLLDVGTTETRGILQSARRGTVTSAQGQQQQQQQQQQARLPPAGQRVTATFKRVLPALRVAMKWVKGHLEYIQRCKDRALTSSQSSTSDSMPNSSFSFDRAPTARESEILLAKSRADGGVVESIFTFWRSSVDFINVLRFAFPWDDLPSLDTLGPLGAPTLCLEEDLDMRGFSPTKKAMLPHASGGMGDACAAIGLSEALPSEEQLMRIADLLFDAKVVAESHTSPITFDDERNAFMYAVPESEEMTDGYHDDSLAFPGGLQGPAPVRQEGTDIPARASALPDADPQQGVPAKIRAGGTDTPAEASSEGFSESTEDVIDLAMRAVDDHSVSMNEPSVTGPVPMHLRTRYFDDDEDEEDMILVPAVRDLWNNAPLGGEPDPVVQRPPSAETGGPVHARVQSQAFVAGGAGSGSRTAQDLLLQMLNGSGPLPAGAPSHGPTGSPHRPAQPLGAGLSTPGPATHGAGAISASTSPFNSGSPAAPALGAHSHHHPAAGQPQPMLFGAMGNTSNSPAAATGGHRGSIWSADAPGTRSSPAHQPAPSNIWGPIGSGLGASHVVGAALGPGAIASPNFAAAQAFVQGGFFPATSNSMAAPMHGPLGAYPPSGPQQHHHASYAYDPRLQSLSNEPRRGDNPFGRDRPQSFGQFPPHGPHHT
ncbi:hypothetical protein V8E36_007317 [Tilletia maclaganii]